MNLTLAFLHFLFGFFMGFAPLILGWIARPYISRWSNQKVALAGVVFFVVVTTILFFVPRTAGLVGWVFLVARILTVCISLIIGLNISWLRLWYSRRVELVPWARSFTSLTKKQQKILVRAYMPLPLFSLIGRLRGPNWPKASLKDAKAIQCEFSKGCAVESLDLVITFCYENGRLKSDVIFDDDFFCFEKC